MSKDIKCINYETMNLKLQLCLISFIVALTKLIHIEQNTWLYGTTEQKQMTEW